MTSEEFHKMMARFPEFRYDKKLRAYVNFKKDGTPRRKSSPCRHVATLGPLRLAK